MIVTAFLFISILLVWLIIGSRGAWYLKLIMLLVSVLLGISIYRALNSYKGWAYAVTWEAMQGTNATLLAFEAQEPDSIFLWIIPEPTNKPVFAYKALPGEPISIRLPYIREAHKQLNTLQKDQYGHANIRFGSNSNGSRDDHSGNMASMSIGGAQEIYQLPPPMIPEKNQ